MAFRHKRSYMVSVGNYVDNGIYVLIELLNKLSVRTVFSCENLTNKGKIQIMVKNGCFQKFEEIMEGIGFIYHNLL